MVVVVGIDVILMAIISKMRAHAEREKRQQQQQLLRSNSKEQDKNKLSRDRVLSRSCVCTGSTNVCTFTVKSEISKRTKDLCVHLIMRTLIYYGIAHHLKHYFNFSIKWNYKPRITWMQFFCTSFSLQSSKIVCACVSVCARTVFAHVKWAKYDTPN